LRTGLLFGRVWVDSQNCPARTAVGAQVIKPLELTTFALPVPDRVLDKFELRGFPEIRNREYRSKHGLKTGVLAFSRKKIHLKKAIVRLALNLDEIRYSDRRFDSRKIVPFPAYAVTSIS
jgi:hypothetical protein